MISLPPAFTERMQQLLGTESEAFFQALVSESPTSIRLNPEKTTITDLPFPELVSQQVPWCSNGYYLKERPSFTSDPLLHGGAYYVQEASSMFLQVVLQQITGNTPLRVLDLCAAPGGKSTLLARSLKGAFDIILVDAPCSGEGMFRKDEKAITEWSENNLRLCEERQKRILSDVWDALAPGGYLVYSTCTYNPGENEEILNWMLTTFDASSIAIQHNFPAITPSPTPLHGYHFYPHKTNGEGLFMGVIQKNDGTPFIMKKEKRATPSPAVKLPADILPLLPDMTPYTPYIAGETLGILPKQHAEFIQYLQSRCHLQGMRNR